MKISEMTTLEELVRRLPLRYRLRYRLWIVPYTWVWARGVRRGWWT